MALRGTGTEGVAPLKSSLTRNVVVNVLGRAWVSGVAILMTPAYLALLGVEAYALIGVFTVLQTLIVLFDLGLGLTLNRHLAAQSEDRQANAQAMRDAVRTFEIVYWVVGVLIAAAIVVSAEFLASTWIHSTTLSISQMTTAIALMGVAIGVQWPSWLYQGGLLGLDRQGTANVILAGFATFRWVGAWFVLLTISPSVQWFFVWQVIASALQTSALRAAVLRSLPTLAQPVRFRRTILDSNIRYAAGLTVLTIVGTIVSQLDKVVLSSVVPLRDFGYYTLAGTIAGGLYIFVAPVFNAVFPRLVSDLPTARLASTYHRACQLASLLLLPVAASLVVFAPEVLSVWLGDAIDVNDTALLLRVLACATALQALLYVPNALMLAAGWTRLPIAVNSVAIVILLPTILLLAQRFGAIGGAIAWLIYNVGYVFIGIAVMHRRLLRGHAAHWYLVDIAGPLVGAVGGALAIRLIVADPSSRLGLAALVFGAVFTATAGAFLLTPFRESATDALRRRLSRQASASMDP